MTNQAAYFKCDVCDNAYTYEQFQALESSTHNQANGEYLLTITCDNCQHNNSAIRKGGPGSALIVKQSIPDDLPYQTEEYSLSQPSTPPSSLLAIQSDFNLTDTGNAKRLISLFGKDICYSGGSWYCWSGQLWKKDTDGAIMRYAKKTAENIFEQAQATIDDKERKNLKTWGHKTESQARLKAMIENAQSEDGMTIEQNLFDSNQWLLNTPNGTIDLKTATIRVHRREDYITKTIPVSYDQRADCPIWKAFLLHIMGGNQNLVSFIQRAAGYTLTGSTKEQCLFFLWGTGANGKSTFIETIRELMGDYAQQTDFSTFLKNNQSSIRNDVARLQGARYVSGVEAGAGQEFEETLIKRLTGQDKVTARFLYQEHFEFEPVFKIFLGANHRPVIKGADHAIWRRIHLLPFAVTIPPNEQDGSLRDKLRKELPGILNWALEGCLEWQRNGLQPPPEVQLATKEYRQEMDEIADFLSDHCEVGVDFSIPKKDLHDAYIYWCRTQGEAPLSKNDFGTKMKEKNYTEKKSGNVRYWLGIKIMQPVCPIVPIIQPLTP
ncbi:MAG: hypothetical protein HGA96_05920 [Desulfobulbaceae bacterium]|nr:hypothetical protein [Desulfobulbaceae bacterium]